LSWSHDYRFNPGVVAGVLNSPNVRFVACLCVVRSNLEIPDDKILRSQYSTQIVHKSMMHMHLSVGFTRTIVLIHVSLEKHS
jgi:hypothetical protein